MSTKIIDNTSLLLGEDLKDMVGCGVRLKIAASCFSIYDFGALKAELSKVESLLFIFTVPTFVAVKVTDRLRKERREFFRPAIKRECGLYGTEFELSLRNKLIERAMACQCADWIRKKALWRSNTTKVPMRCTTDSNRRTSSPDRTTLAACWRNSLRFGSQFLDTKDDRIAFTGNAERND